MGRLSVAASVSAWVSSSNAEEAAAIAEHASTSGYASLWSALRGTLGMLAKAGKTRSAALELALALVLEQNPCVTGDESIQETADLLLVIARDDDRSDIRVVALRVAAEVLAVRWRSKLQNFDSGISKDVSTRSPHLFTYLPIPYFPSRIFHVFFSDCAHVFGHDIRRVKEAWRGVASAARVGDSFGVFWC